MASAKTVAMLPRWRWDRHGCLTQVRYSTFSVFFSFLLRQFQRPKRETEREKDQTSERAGKSEYASVVSRRMVLVRG